MLALEKITPTEDTIKIHKKKKKRKRQTLANTGNINMEMIFKCKEVIASQKQDFIHKFYENHCFLQSVQSA